MNSTGQSSRSRKATDNFFFESIRQGDIKRSVADDLRDLGFTVSQTEY